MVSRAPQGSRDFYELRGTPRRPFQPNANRVADVVAVDSIESVLVSAWDGGSVCPSSPALTTGNDDCSEDKPSLIARPGVISKSRQTSATTRAVTGRCLVANPTSNALSAMTLMVRGLPRDCSYTSLTASRVKTSMGTPPALLMRLQTYSNVSRKPSARSS